MNDVLRKNKITTEYDQFFFTWWTMRIKTLNENKNQIWKRKTSPVLLTSCKPKPVINFVQWKTLKMMQFKTIILVQENLHSLCLVKLDKAEVWSSLWCIPSSNQDIPERNQNRTLFLFSKFLSLVAYAEISSTSIITSVRCVFKSSLS